MSQAAGEAYLRDFHDRQPGATSLCFATAATRRGELRFDSPYACLADIVPAGPAPLKVLDLACGDGFLLEQLAARRQPGLCLIGLDMSPGELARGTRRLGAAAELRLGRAQALPIPDASLDVVVCHMALMLMDDLDRVVGEIRRVLRPGGRFSAIVGARPVGSEVFDLWLPLLTAQMSADGVPGLRLGDARARTKASWPSLATDFRRSKSTTSKWIATRHRVDSGIGSRTRMTWTCSRLRPGSASRGPSWPQRNRCRTRMAWSNTRFHCGS